jgi:hypothetical protein
LRSSVDSGPGATPFFLRFRYSGDDDQISRNFTRIGLCVRKWRRPTGISREGSWEEPESMRDPPPLFRARKNRSGAPISCRKSEIELSLPNEQFVPCACRTVGWPFQTLFPDDKSARKNLLRRISCNPLINLDSDERIQGNPSFSKPQNLGFSQRNGPFQENPNWLERTERCGRPE